MSALVILPTYNERENLPEIVPAILANGETFHVLVVDDNSPDGTGELAAELARREPRVSVLRREGKRGLGTAYLAGFAWALERSFSAVFEMDADFSHDPADLPRLLAATDEADLVIGSRWVPGGGTKNWSFLRTFISRGGSLYARAVLRVPIKDLTSGFKCFRAETLAGLDLGRIRSNGYGFQVEVNYLCHISGYRIAEVPIVFVDRRVGRSKMSGNIVIEAMISAWRLRLQAASLARRSARYSRMP